MKNTFVYDGGEYKRAIGYDEDWNKNDYLITTADGGIISTVSDLLLWDKAFFGDKIISEESKQEMCKSNKLEDGTVINYGFGWDIGPEFEYLQGKDKNVVSHTGGLAGFAAYNQYDTKNNLYVILLSNQKRPELINLRDDINKELYKNVE